MKKLYDDLHDKGLEVVAVTKYYGYYKTERNLTPEVEFEKLAGWWITEEAKQWPLIVGPQSNFDALGVRGIPQFVLIGRDGKVKKFQIGYSAAIFAPFRAEVEKAVAEK